MKRILLIGLIVFAGSAFAAKPKHPPQPTADESLKALEIKMIGAAEERVSGSLKDPESARFRRVFVSPHGRAVCGEINAKNSMGGYVGFRRFIVIKGRIGIEEDNTAFVESNWVGWCINDDIVDDSGK